MMIHEDNNEVLEGQEVYNQRSRWIRIAIVLLFFVFVYVRVWMYVIDIGSMYLIVVYALANLTLLWAFFYWRRRRMLWNQNHDIDLLMDRGQLNRMHGQEGLDRLTHDDIARLKTIVYCSEDKGKEHESSNQVQMEEPTCSICLSEFVTSDLLIALDCHHSYHYKCIHDWLIIRNFCPMCKTPVVPNTNDNNGDNDDFAQEELAQDNVEALARRI